MTTINLNGTTRPLVDGSTLSDLVADADRHGPCCPPGTLPTAEGWALPWR